LCFKRGDSLRKLASKAQYGGKEANYVCLWPVEGTKDHGYPSNIWLLDKYDARNLAIPATDATSYSANLTTDLAGQNGQTTWPQMVASQAGQVPTAIKDTSHEGESPISSLLIFGHGGNCDQNNNCFTADQITALSQPISFTRAEQMHGPSRCWFSRDAVARFAGCSSSPQIAIPFAHALLRSGAMAIGTNQTVAFYGQDALWNYSSPTQGTWTWGNKGPWVTAPIWVTTPGNL
jgi:hypothetical protein